MAERLDGLWEWVVELSITKKVLICVFCAVFIIRYLSQPLVPAGAKDFVASYNSDIIKEYRFTTQMTDAQIHDFYKSRVKFLGWFPGCLPNAQSCGSISYSSGVRQIPVHDIYVSPLHSSSTVEIVVLRSKTSNVAEVHVYETHGGYASITECPG